MENIWLRRTPEFSRRLYTMCYLVIDYNYSCLGNSHSSQQDWTEVIQLSPSLHYVILLYPLWGTINSKISKHQRERFPEQLQISWEVPVWEFYIFYSQSTTVLKMFWTHLSSCRLLCLVMFTCLWRWRTNGWTEEDTLVWRNGIINYS